MERKKGFGSLFLLIPLEVSRFLHTFGATILTKPLRMARIRSASNPFRRGGQGDTTFFIRKREQCTRVRRNSSNYGSTARRTLAQQYNRARWGNLVNLWKAFGSVLRDAFQLKSPTQTDYNAFMRKNYNESPIYLTKEQCAANGAIFYDYQISEGTLPSITLGLGQGAGVVTTSLKTSLQSVAGISVGAWAADIIANNDDFKEGDAIAVLLYRQLSTASGVERGFVNYTEGVLNSHSTYSLEDLFQFSPFYVAGGVWCLDCAEWYGLHGGVGISIIHTRRARKLMVSTQRILMLTNEICSHYMGAAWAETCAYSYGVDSVSQLTPSDGQ